MKLITRLISLLAVCAAVVVSAVSAVEGHADGEHTSVQTAAGENGSDAGRIAFGKCRAAAVYECTTGTLLAGYNEKEALPAGHLAKLMTFLIAAEMVSCGDLSLEDTAVCSHNANSQQGSQIWLDEGEKISVSELMRSISVGNANDACVCLAERICASEKAFTDAANRKAKSLDMNDSYFDDSTGTSENTRITAADVCRLCSELVKYRDFAGCFTTWIDTVRNGKAELVSRNRLMRTYKGTSGFKVCYTPNLGECAAVCAERGDMVLCAVVLGADDEEQLFKQIKDMLDSAFGSYEIYFPEVPEEAVSDMPVGHGEKPACKTDIPGLSPAVIKKGTYRSIEVGFQREEKLEAPVSAGTTVGHISFSINGSELISEDICTAETIDKVDFAFSFKRILSNLLKI